MARRRLPGVKCSSFATCRKRRSAGHIPAVTSHCPEADRMDHL